MESNFFPPVGLLDIYCLLDVNNVCKCNQKETVIPTFGTVSFTLFTFLRLISVRMGDDNFLVCFGTNQSTSHFHSHVVIYRQGNKEFKGCLYSKNKMK